MFSKRKKTLVFEKNSYFYKKNACGYVLKGSKHIIWTIHTFQNCLIALRIAEQRL